MEQGPQLQPRNWLADRAREYGLYGLSNRLNDPTSGAGIVADGVGGLVNMLVVEPYQSMNRMLERPMVSGDPRNAEDAFNVAGAAMVGGLAAPRPRGSVGMGGRPTQEAGAAVNALADNQPAVIRGYHGGTTYDWKTGKPYTELNSANGPWSAFYSTDPNVANRFAQSFERGAVFPADIRLVNPKIIDAGGRHAREMQFDPNKPRIDWSKYNTTTGEHVKGLDGFNEMFPWSQDFRDAITSPHYDGVIIRNTADEGDIIIPTARGTVRSPLTGELLYANGGRHGAAMGAVNNLLAGYGYPQPAQPQQRQDWTRNVRPGDI